MEDQLGNIITLAQPPRRIISLVPSQTELLFDLGLQREIVGITKFCIHPADKVKLVTQIGGTKNFDLNLIKSLKPDLIIGNKEENYEQGIKALQNDFPVWMSDIFTLEDALDMIRKVGQLLNRAPEADTIATNISNSFSQLTTLGPPQPTAAYLIWRKPFMAAAKDTFIDNILQKAGFTNVFNHLSRYPEINPTQLHSANPDFIFLSSEPYPFTQKHIAELQEICPFSKILLVDGELFSWYGSRLVKSAAYFLELRQRVSKFFIS
ncbi:ABC transporter substrate-binding protein [Runella sp.]|uniref:ABC transporter substrate-binding protein n=1 Tax=Runella sp. TaxID=1960881 RepID=UPI00262F0E9A|nr:helical backbone metal receptor [Runella sp.]